METVNKVILAPELLAVSSSVTTAVLQFSSCTATDVKFMV
jgi:hypothetical protein